MKHTIPSSVRVLLVSVAILLPPSIVAQESPSIRQKVATIGERTVYEDELLPLMEDQLQRLRNQEYELKSRALDKLIDQLLLDAAASRKGITRDQLLEQQVAAKVPEPTEAEVEAFYLGQGEFGPLEEVKGKLKEALKQAKIEHLRSAFMDGLRREAAVSVLLAPPKVEVGYDASRVRGNANAPVTIVEFSDFQCPFCRGAEETIKKVMAEYGDKVKVAYRDFPLRSAHPRAEASAEASRCAGEQGKYWEYHDLLFSAPAKLDPAGLLEHATALQLNETQFLSCLNSEKYKSAVDADLKAGSRARVNATPAFFVNGVFISGAQPASVFSKAIDSELARLNADQVASANKLSKSSNALVVAPAVIRSSSETTKQHEKKTNEK